MRPVLWRLRILLWSSGLYCSSCCLVVHPDICLKRNSSLLFRICASNAQKGIDTGLKRKHFLLLCVLPLNTRYFRFIHPVPTMGDPRGDESHCSSSAGCENIVIRFSLSTSTLVLSVYFSGLWGRRELYDLV